MKNEYINAEKIQFSYKDLNKEDQVVDSWCSSRDFNAYRRYTANGYFEKINSALRTGYTDDICVEDDILALDRLFQQVPKQITPKTDMEVFRGVSLKKELTDILQGKSDTDIYVDKAFVSTSKSKQVAKQFALGEDKVILHITIPKGSKIIDDYYLPSYVRSKMAGEEEVLLPRNAQFKITNYNPKTKVVDAIYLGSKCTSEMPQLYRYSGRDVLSDLNKTFINTKNDFLFDKKLKNQN